MTHSWRTAWQGQDIIVFRDDTEVDRVSADQIQRVIFIYAGQGESVGDLVHAVVEVADDILVMPASTGFGGRVNFERLDYWASRSCVHWVAQAHAKLPLRLRGARWWLGLSAPGYSRVPKSDLASLIERWPLDGPQTWEQRKWRRIQSRRPFADDHRARA